MNLASLRIACLLAGGLLLACSESLPLHLGKEVEAHAYCWSGARRDVAIQPGTPTHQALTAWIAQNQGGWQAYLATPPAQGVTVRAGSLNLQFLDAAVLTRTEKGILTNTTQESSHAFLSALCKG